MPGIFGQFGGGEWKWQFNDEKPAVDPLLDACGFKSAGGRPLPPAPSHQIRHGACPGCGRPLTAIIRVNFGVLKGHQPMARWMVRITHQEPLCYAWEANELPPEAIVAAFPQIEPPR